MVTRSCGDTLYIKPIGLCPTCANRYPMMSGELMEPLTEKNWDQFYANLCDECRA